jgi:hypothetical protein
MWVPGLVYPGILLNRNNHDQMGMRRNATRSTKRQTHRKEHDELEIGDSILEAQEALAALTANQKVAAARLKELKVQKKELGRVPLHSGSSKATSASSIPKLVGSAAHSDDGKSLISSSFIASLILMNQIPTSNLVILICLNPFHRHPLVRHPRPFPVSVSFHFWDYSVLRRKQPWTLTPTFPLIR